MRGKRVAGLDGIPSSMFHARRLSGLSHTRRIMMLRIGQRRRTARLTPCSRPMARRRRGGGAEEGEGVMEQPGVQKYPEHGTQGE